jgi:predicted choloylglycine hydrolase
MYHNRYKGNHYNAGYKYGSLLKKFNHKIDNCPTFKIDDSRIEFSKKCIEEYQTYYPEILEEIKGMANGNETNYEFLIAMLLSMYCFNVENKCSCLAFKDKDNIIFGRNSDFLVSLEKFNMNVIYDLDNSYAFNGNTTAFIEIEDGINEYGLAIGLTFVPVDKVKPGFNAGMLVRYLLEKCKTVDECITRLKELPIATAQILTIADSTGKLMVVECNCDNVEVINSNDERDNVFSTNIFMSDKMKKYNLNHFDNWRAEDRYSTIRSSLNNNKNYSVELARDILSGKYGFICQYDRKTNADTVWSVIYDIKNKVIYRVEGNPSRKEF